MRGERFSLSGFRTGFVALSLSLAASALVLREARAGEETPRSAPREDTEERRVVLFSFSCRPELSTESVFLLGDLDELGGDDVRRAVPLQAADRRHWRLSVSLPRDREVTYAYWIRDHRETKLESPRNGTRISEEMTLAREREPRPGGKGLMVHSTLEGPILHWRQENEDYDQIVLEKVGAGRFAGEHRWRARGFGLARRRFQFFLTDRKQTLREPLEGVYETPLDRMFLQDQSLFTYVPAPSVSPMRRDYGLQPRTLKSKVLGQVRSYRVMLPRGYDEHTGRSYPVLYFYDGQIIWDPHSTFVPWDLDGKRMAELVRNGEVREMILVAFFSDLPRRLAEVTPPEDVVYGTTTPGRAGELVEFLTTELKPLIDSTYRTLPGREDTFLTGFSGGGLLALYAAWEYYRVFGAVALQSAGLGAAPNFAARVLKDLRLPFRIYLDAGTRDRRDPAGNAFFGLSQRLWSDLLGDSPPAVLERDIRVRLGLKHKHDFVDAGRRIRPLMTFLGPARLECDEELWELTQ